MNSIMTPLRWKIATGYLVAIIVTVALRHELADGWSLLKTFLAPLFAFLSALVALKFGFVIAAIGSFLLVFLQGMLGLVIAVSKMGIIKGLFLPWLLSGLKWLHKKSAVLQKASTRLYDLGTSFASKLWDWWNAKNLVDRVLLLGFLGPLLIVIVFAVLIKRFVYLFISKKAVEQIVQKATKTTVKHFHKIPLIGKIPATVNGIYKELLIRRDAKLKKVGQLPAPEEPQA